VLCLGLLMLHVLPAPAETTTDSEEIIVTSQRVEKPLLETPAAVTVVADRAIQLAQQALTLNESLGAVPGIYLQNQYNFAQGTRISTRGFGARTPFGIRGINLLVDGIPLTLPDGQTQLDSIDLGSAERIEVLRGASASLYGSSAGGVISITSEDGPSIPFASATVAGGHYGYFDLRAKAGGQAGDFNYLFSLSPQVLDGYRDHSRMERVLLNSKLRYDIDDRSDLTLLLSHLYRPTADDAGGLTAQQVLMDRRQARPQNLLFDAGESVDNTRLGLVYRRESGAHHETSISTYYTWRDFENRLPFQSGGSTQLDRLFLGGGAQHEYVDEWFGLRDRLLAGIDAKAQLDDRTRRDNDFGSIGAMTLDQSEDVLGVGVFLQNEFQLPWDLELTGSLRYDWIDFEVEDHFLDDASDDSGKRTFDAWSGMLGLLWSPGRAFNAYFKVANSFETPTTTELANPSGNGGFNPLLEPETALHLEIGAKGNLAGRVQYEVAVFHIRLHDELVPFELESSPGRTFFENAGRSKRTGLELGTRTQLLSSLALSLTYTFSHFEFEDFLTLDDSGAPVSHAGNALPGVPRNEFRAELSYEHPTGLFASWVLHYVDIRYVDNSNSAKAPDYLISGLRMGYVGRWGRWEVSHYLGLNNLLDKAYTDNVRINAFGGSYYEPAPGFNAYGGVSLRYHFGP